MTWSMTTTKLRTWLSCIILSWHDQWKLENVIMNDMVYNNDNDNDMVDNKDNDNNLITNYHDSLFWAGLDDLCWISAWPGTGLHPLWSDQRGDEENLSQPWSPHSHLGSGGAEESLELGRPQSGPTGLSSPGQQSGALSLVQICPDTLLWLVDTLLCHNNMAKGCICCLSGWYFCGIERAHRQTGSIRGVLLP